jgi:hypothetical protein
MGRRVSVPGNSWLVHSGAEGDRQGFQGGVACPVALGSQKPPGVPGVMEQKTTILLAHGGHKSTIVQSRLAISIFSNTLAQSYKASSGGFLSR